MALLRGQSLPSPPMDPSLTVFQSEQVVYMLTTSGCQVDFASLTLWFSISGVATNFRQGVRQSVAFIF